MQHVKIYYNGAPCIGGRSKFSSCSGAPVTCKTICLPKQIHTVANEVAFREEITLKQLICDSLGEYINGGHYSCRTFEYHYMVRPSVILPVESCSKVRQIAHENCLSQRDIFCESLCRYIHSHFVEKYPDIIGIKDI